MPYRVFDHVEVRCPKLGGEVTFGYCRVLEDGLPCSRALVCFELQFPVEVFFRKILREETFHRCFAGQRADRYGALLATVHAACAAEHDEADPGDEEP